MAKITESLELACVVPDSDLQAIERLQRQRAVEVAQEREQWRFLSRLEARRRRFMAIMEYLETALKTPEKQRTDAQQAAIIRAIARGII